MVYKLYSFGYFVREFWLDKAKGLLYMYLKCMYGNVYYSIVYNNRSLKS